MLTGAGSLDVVSVCTSPEAPPPTDLVEELHSGSRPWLGRIEHTRLAPALGALDLAYQRRLAGDVRAAAANWGAEAVHSVAHSFDFWPAFCVAEELGLPYLLSAHDDLGYALRGSPIRRLALRRLGEAWRGADARFVITDALGREYSERYGERPFSVVTDGIEDTADRPPEPNGSDLHVYFMGAYHAAYRDNFDALLAALAQLRAERAVSLTWRGGGLPFEHESDVPMEVRGFASEAVIREEAAAADLLFLPLPFGRAHRDFVRFSLSTKLVAYLGSGRPILYHGPEESAAARLLIEHDAAIVVDSPRPEDLVAALDRELPRARSIAANALALAWKEFSLTQVRERFLSGLAR